MRNFSRHSNRRRGSALLIVLALLSILVLLAATLAYTSRLDVISSQNFGEGVQRTVSAVSAIDKAAQLAQERLPKDAIGTVNLERVAGEISDSPAYANAAQSLNNSLQPKNPHHSAPQPKEGERMAIPNPPGRGHVLTGTSLVFLSDLSARVNINTADSETLESLFSRVAQKNNLRNVDARGVAQAIVARRLGRDGAPGRRGKDDDRRGPQLIQPEYERVFAIHRAQQQNEPYEFILKQLKTDDPELESRLGSGCLGLGSARLQTFEALYTSEDDSEEYIADVRYPPFGDDYRFGNLGQLLEVRGMSQELFAASHPYLTVFSVTQESRLGGRKNGAKTSLPLTDLNRASAEEIYEALREEYGNSKDDALLRQFAVNVVDARDPDDVPTVMHGGLNQTPVIGFERTPLITEIYANAISEDETGDDGQFLEIHNPWSQNIDLDGWMVRVAGMSFPLRGTLSANGYLIVTDDYDNSMDSSTDQELPSGGSFYDIFGLTENGMSKRVLDFPRLNIPHRQGTYSVQLMNGNGDLIDEFVYRVSGEVSPVRSFQRLNPLVREWQLDMATPFNRQKAKAPDADTVERLRRGPRNAAFSSTLELFEVFAGYARENGTEGSRWGFPALATPNSDDAEKQMAAMEPGLLDARLIDIFSVEIRPRPKGSATASDEDGSDEAMFRIYNPWQDEFPDGALSEDARRNGRRGTSAEALKEAEAVAWTRYSAKPAGHRVGRVNINTAGETVLESVGFSQLAAQRIVSRRQEMETKFHRGEAVEGAAYQKLSDVLADQALWSRPEDRCAVLQEFAPIADRITTTSRAFLLECLPLEAADSVTQSRSGVRVQAIVAMDHDRPEIVSWQYVY